MLTPEKTQILRDLRNTNYGKVLQEFLDEKYKEIGDIKSCNSWEDTKGRQYAIKILDDIFAFMKDKVDLVNKARYD